MVADPIADLINRLKNASAIKKESVSVPFSNLKFEIASLLSREGFVSAVERRGKKVKKYLDITLKYADGAPSLRGAERVSRLSKRVYFKVSDIKPVKHGQGLLVLSTPKGLMTDKEARKEKVGGEALFKIW
ncbi:MAG TPA: 30S ribosomal protein S8 [Candidatus Paceibacterota bacterium]|nr:30S ribosomal protein S8 [Candidatus Paceibacterota bacterium]